MNRFSIWKYLLILTMLILASLYTIPNFFGEAPAIQISSIYAAKKIDTALMQKLEQSLSTQRIMVERALLEPNCLKFQFSSPDLQLRARDILQSVLGKEYSIAMLLMSRSPSWLSRLGAKPMALGLDLRGGVHFALEVDMKAVTNKAFDKLATDIRRELHQAKVRYGKMQRHNGQLFVLFRDAEAQSAAQSVLKKHLNRIQIVQQENYSLNFSFEPGVLQQLETDAVKQNINILHNRVNELGVAEPIIQQQGLGKIVVELPGVQDPAKAKEILGRTAALEVRLVEDDPEKVQQAREGVIPVGFELIDDLSAADHKTDKILVRKAVELNGEHINDAQAGFGERGEAAVHINLDSVGATIFREITRANVNKRLAMILVEKNKAEVVTAPVIRGEISGGRVQISGAMGIAEANDIALLLRAGALAAPMHIVEERIIGPSLGQDNIVKGFNATLYGFMAIAAFMILYYSTFGIISALALLVNLLLLIALLSLLQATLTLPGIAAIALTLGMAIDSNVLINERIREELRNGLAPRSAIFNGYKHAWATILDSNITTLIAGFSLFIFGSGAIRGFAIVHCLGILTSMFSAVFFSRALVHLIYSYRRRVNKIWI